MEQTASEEINDIQYEKKNIRNKIKAIKSVIPDAEKQLLADLVFSKLELLPEFWSANTIFIYWSLPDELPTHKFIDKWWSTKQFILPSVVDNAMILKRYSGPANMIIGQLGISEPITQANYEEQIDLVIVPGIAFDRQKNRLGRGKGFYDRFLDHKEIYKIGVCFDFQLLDSIPATSDDIKMNKIISTSDIV